MTIKLNKKKKPARLQSAIAAIIHSVIKIEYG